MLSHFKKIICIIGLCLYAVTGKAVEISPENYDIYKGDINADGNSDFYFHPKRKFLILHGDIAIPVVYSNPQGFVIYGSFNGGVNSYGTPIAFELSENVLQIRVSVSNLKLTVANIDYSSWFDTPSGVVLTRLYAGDLFVNLSSTKNAPLPTILSVARRSVVFIHTDLLGSPAAETNAQGN